MGLILAAWFYLAGFVVLVSGKMTLNDGAVVKGWEQLLIAMMWPIFLPVGKVIALLTRRH